MLVVFCRHLGRATGILCENVTSSTKPKVGNAIKRIDVHQITAMGYMGQLALTNWVKLSMS